MEKIENGQNIIKTIEPDIPKNLAKDFDAEMDDIFTKLGTLSPSNSSFDSPIPLNRNKKFFDEFQKDIPKTLKRNTTKQFLHCRTNCKSINKEQRTQKIYGNKFSNLYNTENKNLKPNKIIKTGSKLYKKNNEIKKTHIKLKSNEVSLRNLNKSFNKTFHFKENINHNLPIINENTRNNKNKENIKIINEKIQIITALLKDIKEIDNKLKKKDLKKIINILLVNKNNIDNLYESLIQILDFIIDILYSFKINRNKSNNKIGNEKIILKLKNELKEKEKQIGEIINNSKFEQDKLQDIINTNNIDITNLKKENKEMLNKLSIYQKQLSKIESNKEILEEKINKIIIDKTTKSYNSSTSVRGTFIENIYNKPKLDNLNSITLNLDESNLDHLNMTQQMPQRYIPPSEQTKNINVIKLNEKYNLSKKLNMNLLDLLKEINNFLCLYDSILNKESFINKSKNLGNNTKNLVNNIDINILIEENKTKIFCNDFMRNVEIVYNKMEEFIKSFNNKSDKGIGINKNNNEIINKSKTLKTDKIFSTKKNTKTLGNYKSKK